MKKLLAAVLLAVVLLTIPAAAAENSMENFIRERTYDNQFSDLSADSAFYENVMALYEYGLTVGKSDGTFGVKDNLTVSQIVIFAGRIRSLYTVGDAEAGAAAYKTEESRAVCMAYLDYLKMEGVLGDELDAVLFTAATRAQMAHVLSRVLPQEAIPEINAEIMSELRSKGFAPDVTEETPYWQDILWLYTHGVSHGSDERGTFYPAEPITRGAVAAMLTRLVTPELRIRLVWKEEPVVPDISGTTLADLVRPGAYIASPSTQEEMDESIRFMLASGKNALELYDSDVTFTKVHDIMQQALTTVKVYCEQGYNYVSSTYSVEGDITLTFSAVGAEKAEGNYRKDYLKAAIQVHDELWRAGFLTAEMTEMEKASVYYAWVCGNAEYDYEAGDESLSHTPYNVFYNGLAVCDGYTGAYNLLLKLEGIDCYGYYQDNHMWTIAQLDGAEYHIDTTWGDVGDAGLAEYFAMVPEMSWVVHASEE